MFPVLALFLAFQIHLKSVEPSGPIPVSDLTDPRAAAIAGHSPYWTHVLRELERASIYGLEVELEAGDGNALHWPEGQVLILESEYGEIHAVGDREFLLASHCNQAAPNKLPWSDCQIVYFRPGSEPDVSAMKMARGRVYGHLVAPLSFGKIVAMRWEKR